MTRGACFLPFEQSWASENRQRNFWDSPACSDAEDPPPSSDPAGGACIHSLRSRSLWRNPSPPMEQSRTPQVPLLVAAGGGTDGSSSAGFSHTRERGISDAHLHLLAPVSRHRAISDAQLLGAGCRGPVEDSAALSACSEVVEMAMRVGITLKYVEPPERSRPLKLWALYEYHADACLHVMPVNTCSYYVFGRDELLRSVLPLLLLLRPESRPDPPSQPVCCIICVTMKETGGGGLLDPPCRGHRQLAACCLAIPQPARKLPSHGPSRLPPPPAPLLTNSSALLPPPCYSACSPQSLWQAGTLMQSCTGQTDKWLMTDVALAYHRRGT
jgi:hypothetical protein